VLEGDRGEFFVHLLCVERGRVHQREHHHQCAWSNKDCTWNG
jgi:hypothetical protein